MVGTCNCRVALPETPRLLSVLVKPTSEEDMQTARYDVEATMRVRHRLRPTEPNDFAIETASDNSNSGSGSIQRQEKISLTIAATVAQVLPNGNMVIQGRQEVRTNREVRELTVAGIVRPEDISSANVIRHDQIAEARISYGGRGDISRIQGAPAAQALVERFNPF